MFCAVRGAHAHERYAVALGMVLACMLLACPGAFALNPALDVNQYAHTAWKVREGFAKSEITSIAQTPDGYLWLGTEFGLLRFDSAKSVPWQPPPDQPLPSTEIFSLLAARDATLWVGTGKGLASWKDGKLTQYPELADHVIFAIVEDRDETIWASAGSVTLGKLCAIRSGKVQCYGEGILGRGAFSLYVDSKGNLWAGVKNGLWRWSPGPAKYYPLPGEPDGIQAMSEETDGTLLVGWNGGLHRLVDGKTEAYPLPGFARPFRARRLLRDPDGGLWIGTTSQGLVHVHQARTDVFAQPDGLSGDVIQKLFLDREGSIWVASMDGLDRFRDFAVAMLTPSQDLSSAAAVLADRDGSLWLSTRSGLIRWNHRHVKTHRLGHERPGGKLNNLATSLFQDDRGRVWLGTFRGFGYLENDRFVPISTVPGGTILSIVQDRAGTLWVDNEHSGLFRLSPGGNFRKIPWADLGHKDHASILAIDPSRDGLWLGFHLGGIAYYADGRIRESYTTADGLGAGRVRGFQFDREGAVWISTEDGLSRLKNGRIATLTSKNGLPCDTVNWAMEDDEHAFWLYTACGLVRIARPEVEAWAAAADKDKDTQQKIQAVVFDTSDGVRSLSDSNHFSPQVAKTADGRLWFLPQDGVSVVDPRRLPFNKLPPPVHIEQIIADRKIYEAASDGTGELHLPPQVRDLQIDYTALSFVAPEKVRFRYKLEGWDRDWQEVGTRRQAFYSNLPPRNYRFRVTASNNSGVWNEAGTSLPFFIAPAYYQTTWFRLVSLAAFLAILAALYHVRLRQLARQFNMRMEERVSERTRIARDLHDTLLQSFQGVLLKFHAVTYELLDRPEAKGRLENVIEEARGAITEGRDAVQGLRSSAVSSNDLAQSLSALAQGLAADPNGRSTPHFLVHVEGTPRHLAPLLGEEVYRIACEAVRNAFLHAHADRIEVEIRYDHRQLRLRVRDNGKGINPKFLDGAGPAGHYGLAGMHERAKLLGGKLALWSELDSGSEAELTIPASIAYAKSQPVRRAKFWQRGA